MVDKHRSRTEVDRKYEQRIKEISQMISEGGLGADQYCEIIKYQGAASKGDEQFKNGEK